MQAIEYLLGIPISALPRPEQSLAASVYARRPSSDITPALERIFLAPLTFRENEDTNRLKNINLVQHNVVPCTEGHDAVALPQEGVSLRG